MHINIFLPPFAVTDIYYTVPLDGQMMDNDDNNSWLLH